MRPARLPAVPDEGKLKSLLLHCLEEHYGSLEGAVVQSDRAIVARARCKPSSRR